MGRQSRSTVLGSRDEGRWEGLRGEGRWGCGGKLFGKGGNM